jgi:hypothetical protein
MSSLGSVTNLTDGSGNPATFSTSAWYTPTAPSSTASAATLHCDGTPLTGDTGYRVNGTVAPINSVVVERAEHYLRWRPVYDDARIQRRANIDLRQVGATGGEFASLASVLTFGSSQAPLTIAAGGSASVGAAAPWPGQRRHRDPGQRRKCHVGQRWHHRPG